MKKKIFCLLFFLMFSVSLFADITMQPLKIIVSNEDEKNIYWPEGSIVYVNASSKYYILQSGEFVETSPETNYWKGDGTLGSFSGIRSAGGPIYNITANYDLILLPIETAANITKVYALCQGGTNVTFMIEKCDINGSGCTRCNATDWTADNNTALFITSFENSTLVVNETLKINTTAGNGNPPGFTFRVWWQE